jgi:hypothetical protein
MQRRLLTTFARGRSEGDAVTFAGTQGLSRDALLSMARSRLSDADPARIYLDLWTAKGTIARVVEQRLLRARAVAGNPALATKVAELTVARQRRGELVYAPPTQAPGTLKGREAELKKLDEYITN